MPNFTVLVAVDLSASAASALATAQELCLRLAPATMHLLYVMPVLDGGSSESEAGARDDGEHELRAFVASHGVDPEAVALHVVCGSAAECLVEHARTLGSDLVVVGCAARAGGDPDFFGVTAGYALRHAPCPILMAHTGGHENEGGLAPPCPDCIETRQSSELNHAFCSRHSDKRASREPSIAALDALMPHPSPRAQTDRRFGFRAASILPPALRGLAPAFG